MTASATGGMRRQPKHMHGQEAQSSPSIERLSIGDLAIPDRPLSMPLEALLCARAAMEWNCVSEHDRDRFLV
jgi:hypothetical protein